MCICSNGAKKLAFSAVTHLMVSRLLVRLYMNPKRSKVLWVVPHRFAYTWYAIDVHIASRLKYTFYIDSFSQRPCKCSHIQKLPCLASQ